MRREKVLFVLRYDVDLKRGETEMPSAKILNEKQAYVASLKEKIAASCAGVVVSYKGITVENDTKLRKELREAGVEYMVVKNTMLRLAFKGTEMEVLLDTFKGDTAIAFSNEDPIVAARVLNDFAEKDKSKQFAIKGGYVDGEVLSVDKIKELAKLPDLKGMLSMFAGALTGTLSGLAVAMQAYVDKQENGEAA